MAPTPALAMVGRVGVEPTTSRLSGVRSNHLSYRPRSRLAGLMAAGGVCQLRQHSGEGVFSRMKGHEDGGNVLWKRRKHSDQAEPKSGAGAFRHDPSKGGDPAASSPTATLLR